MKRQNLFTKDLSVFNLIIIALMAAIGVAVKPVIVPLIHIVTGPLFIPGGAVAGGLYMMWIIIGICLTGKKGTGMLIGFVQSLLVMVIGIAGGHGVMSIVSYTVPGIAADLVFLFAKPNQYNIIHCMLGCIAANIGGTLMSNILFFRVPFVAVAFITAVAATSGAIGGIIAWTLCNNLKKIKLGV